MHTSSVVEQQGLTWKRIGVALSRVDHVKNNPQCSRINSTIHAEHMGEALIPFYAMLDTRNAIWCLLFSCLEKKKPRDVAREWWMMLERVHACDETCYFIHNVGWREEVYRVFEKKDRNRFLEIIFFRHLLFGICL